MSKFKISVLLAFLTVVCLGAFADMLPATARAADNEKGPPGYYYAFAYKRGEYYRDSNYKVLYVTNLFTAPDGEYKVGITNQWRNRFAAYYDGNDAHKFTADVSYGITERGADESRDEWIARFKSKGYRVEHVGFHYRAD